MTDKYRVFSRRWWKDAKCTIPGAGRKTTIQIVEGGTQRKNFAAPTITTKTAIASGAPMGAHGNMKGFEQ